MPRIGLHHLSLRARLGENVDRWIKSAPLDPPVAPWGDFTDAADYRRKFPDGRIGSNPALATPEAGRRLYDAAVAALASDYLGWIAG